MCDFEGIGIVASRIVEELAAGIPSWEEDEETPAGARSRARAHHAGEEVGMVICVVVVRRMRR